MQDDMRQEVIDLSVSVCEKYSSNYEVSAKLNGKLVN